VENSGGRQAESEIGLATVRTGGDVRRGVAYASVRAPIIPSRSIPIDWNRDRGDIRGVARKSEISFRAPESGIRLRNATDDDDDFHP